LACLLLAACQPEVRDSRFIDDAAALLEQVRIAGGEEYAPLDVRAARERLVDARGLFDQREYERAKWLSEQSEVHSELAEAKARAAQAREAARERRREIDQLRVELLGEES
jgi:hypothetical protein